MDTAAIKRLAGQMLAAGAPTLAELVAGLLPVRVPGTAGMVEWALRQAAKQLGLPADAAPAAIADAIDAADPAEVQARLQPVEQAATEAVERIRAEAEVAKTQVAEVNASIRAEAAATRDGWWGGWRTMLAWSLAVEVPAWVGLILWAVIAQRVTDLVAASPLITTWWTARFGVLGVHLWTGSNERRTAITGQPLPGVVGAVAAAIKGGR